MLNETPFEVSASAIINGVEKKIGPIPINELTGFRARQEGGGISLTSEHEPSPDTLIFVSEVESTVTFKLKRENQVVAIVHLENGDIERLSLAQLWKHPEFR